MAGIESLRAAYSRFYEIRNAPTPETKVEAWKSLPDDAVADWCVRMATQGREVAGLIRELEHMRADRGYHEMKHYFYEDFREMKRDLDTRGFVLEL